MQARDEELLAAYAMSESKEITPGVVLGTMVFSLVVALAATGTGIKATGWQGFRIPVGVWVALFFVYWGVVTFFTLRMYKLELGKPLFHPVYDWGIWRKSFAIIHRCTIILYLLVVGFACAGATVAIARVIHRLSP
ncbi:MAG TPA: hypothetical protein VG984_03795 [Candidatus Paceibacterota bacterium]|nr:hypothetical protein [Candidatus Paceibacterota bacterium]